MDYIHRSFYSIAFNIFNEIISHQRLNLIETNKVSVKIIKYLIIRIRGNLKIKFINQKPCRLIQIARSSLKSLIHSHVNIDKFSRCNLYFLEYCLLIVAEFRLFNL